jgi:glycosyltransferase involved in cell wall biosynthesis
MIVNIGPVEHIGIATLYDAIDAVILPSRLESFSNTIAEAWAMNKPLLISDLSWARSLCADAALYVTYCDVGDIADKICALRHSPGLRARLVDAGRTVLKTYPTARDRFMQYLRIIEMCASAGSKGMDGNRQRVQ